MTTTNEFEFKTTVNMKGEELDAHCLYTVSKGRAIPYSVVINGLGYPVDNWRQRMRKEAQQDLESRRAAV